MSVPKRSSLLAKPMTLATMLVESSSGSRSSSPSASSNGAAKPQQQKKPKPPRPDLPSFSWNTRESEDEPLRTLHYITSLPDAEYFLSQVTGDVVGFDVEWKPNFVKGQAENRIALAQVADRSAIYLVHISLMGWKVPPRLRLILEDGTIRKAGVGIDGDKDKIRRDLGVNLAGPLELSTLAREVDPSAWTEHNGKLISLARLTETYLRTVLEKPKNLQRGNWERSLSQPMQNYAANDAASGLSIYLALEKLRQAGQGLAAATLAPNGVTKSTNANGSVPVEGNDESLGHTLQTNGAESAEATSGLSDPTATALRLIDRLESPSPSTSSREGTPSATRAPNRSSRRNRQRKASESGGYASSPLVPNEQNGQRPSKRSKDSSLGQ